MESALAPGFKGVCSRYKEAEQVQVQLQLAPLAHESKHTHAQRADGTGPEATWDTPPTNEGTYSRFATFLDFVDESPRLHR